MRSWKIASLPALALVLVPAAFSFSTPLNAVDTPFEQQDPEPVLEDHMIQIGRNLRRLKREVGDAAKKEDALARLVTMQLAATQAKGLVPMMVEDAPAEKRAALLQDYRGMQIAFMRSLLDLEQAILEGNQEAASKHLTAVIGWEEKGHAAFNAGE